MHQYLRSIGYSKLTKEKDIDKLLKGFEKRGIATAHRYIDSNEQMWLDIRMPVSQHMGICISGYMGSRGIFHRVAYYPYLWSEDVTSNARPSVFRRVDGELFSAIIDDSRVGMTLIYQMDNPFDYLHKYGEGNSIVGRAASKLSGFCNKGFVLLPSIKADDLRGRNATDGRPQVGAKPDSLDNPGNSGNADNISSPGTGSSVEDSSNAGNGASVNAGAGTGNNAGNVDAMSADIEALLNAGKKDSPACAPTNYNNSDQDTRMSLLEAARNGQTEAIEQLALEEMNTIATLSKRLQNEDIYSIVSSVFMPQGVECDIYLVVGDILNVEKVRNESTREEIYDLTLNVNDMIIHVAINEADLEGEPAVGRRFKGRIWLQGRIEF